MQARSGVTLPMAKPDTALKKLRAICLSLPDTKETITWGRPHFRVGERIFCGCGEEQGRLTIGFKLERPHADLVVDGDRFRRAPYVGRHGWVSMDAERIDDWKLVRAFVEESYRLIATCRRPSRPGRTAGGGRPAPAPRSRPKRAGR